MTDTNGMKDVELFCDGACSGNPGPGGWGVVLRFQDSEKELSGGEPHTTNNRMELMGCIAGLEALRESCIVRVTTDSQYLAKAFGDGWLDKWQRNGWRTSSKAPVKNRELWERLLALAQKHRLSWQWIKGHAGHPENERCDSLAVAARDKASSTR